MEYVSGRSLEERLAAEGALPVADALEIALAVADTMARAHARGIVHRDLKPSNIMLSDDGLVRLLDFGVARVSGTLSLVHTTERAVMGTPGYIAPEVLSGYEADESSDVFSLGVTLFKMLTNMLPFPPRARPWPRQKTCSAALHRRCGRSPRRHSPRTATSRSRAAYSGA